LALYVPRWRWLLGRVFPFKGLPQLEPLTVPNLVEKPVRVYLNYIPCFITKPSWSRVLPLPPTKRTDSCFNCGDSGSSAPVVLQPENPVFKVK